MGGAAPAGLVIVRLEDPSVATAIVIDHDAAILPRMMVRAISGGAKKPEPRVAFHACLVTMHR